MPISVTFGVFHIALSLEVTIMRSLSVYILSLFILYNTHMVNADYTCLCNNGDFPKNIFPSQNSGSDVIGYIKVGICKETSAVTNPQWLSVIHQHQIGYIQNDMDIVVSKCVGTPRPEDDVTTVQPYMSVLSTRIIPNITEGTTTPVSTFLTSVVLTSIKSNETNAMNSPTTIKTMHTKATKSPTTDVNALKNTISVMQATVANTETVSTAVMASATKIALTTATVATTSTTIEPALTTATAATTSRTATTATASTTTTASTTKTAPTTASSSTTTTAATTKTVTPTAEALTTTSTTITATTNIHPISGPTEMCPLSIRSDAQRKGAQLAQFGHKCYEVMQNRVSWATAEITCQRNRGHLVDIASQQEQNFLFHFLESIKSHTVWLGLHDRSVEEKFEWTSGKPVVYTDWKQDGKDKFYHDKHDCVYMTVNGTWDDIYCGSDVLPVDYLHAYVCQYHTVSGPQVVG